MPDITMCVNEKCLLKKVCYRYMAEPGKYQSYAMFTYDSYPSIVCLHFIPRSGELIPGENDVINNTK